MVEMIHAQERVTNQDAVLRLFDRFLRKVSQLKNAFTKLISENICQICVSVPLKIELGVF